MHSAHGSGSAGPGPRTSDRQSLARVRRLRRLVRSLIAASTDTGRVSDGAPLYVVAEASRRPTIDLINQLFPHLSQRRISLGCFGLADDLVLRHFAEFLRGIAQVDEAAEGYAISRRCGRPSRKRRGELQHRIFGNAEFHQIVEATCVAGVLREIRLLSPEKSLYRSSRGLHETLCVEAPYRDPYPSKLPCCRVPAGELCPLDVESLGELVER